MGVYAFKLPDVGEGMAEGTIGKWYVHEGDSIKKDADLVQIENDKSRFYSCCFHIGGSKFERSEMDERGFIEIETSFGWT